MVHSLKSADGASTVNPRSWSYRRHPQLQHSQYNSSHSFYHLIFCSLLLFSPQASGACLGNRFEGPLVGKQSKSPRVLAIEDNVKSVEECGATCNSFDTCKCHHKKKYFLQIFIYIFSLSPLFFIFLNIYKTMWHPR